MSEHPSDNITRLLIELSNGDRAAVDLLLPVIYDELRKLAANYLRRERPDHTLQPTALVHEAYLRLIDQSRVNWQNRAHFFGVAAQIMRRLLVDHARKHNAEKRGQDFQKLSLDENIDRAVERSAELIALDDALMLKAIPGTYAVGEMLDWEAPTGGYLLQACFSTAVFATRAILTRIGA